MTADLVYDDITFEGENHAGGRITGREYQSCTFKNCDFSDAALGHNKFLDCVFVDCNLTMAKLDRATLNDVAFKNCKLLGVNFRDCQDFLFSVKFEGCLLDYASFMDKKMPKTKFANCAMKEVNFTNTNLQGAKFDDCDLLMAKFERTDLSAADLSTAYNFDIDPELNTIKKAAFAEQGLRNLLLKYQLKIS